MWKIFMQNSWNAFTRIFYVSFSQDFHAKMNSSVIYIKIVTWNDVFTWIFHVFSQDVYVKMTSSVLYIKIVMWNKFHVNFTLGNFVCLADEDILTVWRVSTWLWRWSLRESCCDRVAIFCRSLSSTANLISCSFSASLRAVSSSICRINWACSFSYQ